MDLGNVAGKIHHDSSERPRLLPINSNSDPSVLDYKEVKRISKSDMRRKFSEKSSQPLEALQAAFDPVAIGAVLKEARVSAGLTKLQVAAATGLPDKTILRVERGETSSQYSIIEKIAKAVGLRPIVTFEIEP